MSDELSPQARAVLASLREKPALNTATLIAMEQEFDHATTEAALRELKVAELVVQRPLGWRAAAAKD